MVGKTIYTAGGTVQAGGGIYIPRHADKELFNLCYQSVFTYVLTPRQIGKSSLMVQTATLLQHEGIHTVIIDLTEIGTQLSAEQWYLGLLTEIGDQLDLDTDPLDWWEEYTHLGMTQRLTRFFSQVVLAEVDAPIVIFVDEIDTTLSLDFTDDFFVSIRFLYNKRAENKELIRLSFVLLGVATPSDLIHNSQRTPFNIGQAVSLEDFTYDEALPLAQGLDLLEEQSQNILRWVLEWTDGHPYLTQKTFRIISENPTAYTSKSKIKNIFKDQFLKSGHQSENNLRFVRDSILDKGYQTIRMLNAYRHLLHKKGDIENSNSEIYSYLQLSGLVKRKGEKLIIRNLLYRTVFDRRWISRELSMYGLETSLVNFLKTVVVTSLVVTGCLSFFRFAGAFESWELAVYDGFFSQKPIEPLDDRLLVVGIDEKDMQSRREYPIKESTVVDLIQALEVHNPTAIALDFALDFPQGTDAERAELEALLASKDNIVSACIMSSPSFPGVPPGPGVSEDQVGFADFPQDRDGIIRRAILISTPSEVNGGEVVQSHLCNQPDVQLFSLSFLLALIYLEEVGLFAEQTESGALVWDNTLISRLLERSGGYARSGATDYQIMLNYRAPRDAVRTVSLTQVLENQVDPDWIRDRVVLIGYTSPVVGDILTTPYEETTPGFRGMYGVMVHAQATSQIISAVLDGRPLIYAWPELGDILLVGVCSFVSGIIAFYIRRWALLIIVTIGSISLLWIFAYVVFLVGFWLPIVPITVTVGFTIVTVSIVSRVRKSRVTHRIFEQIKAEIAGEII